MEEQAAYHIKRVATVRPTAKFQRLEKARNVAAQRLQDALAAHWPEAAQVRVYLRWPQRVPSAATVRSVDGHGQALVVLTKTNRRGRHTVKRVHWTRIAP